MLNSRKACNVSGKIQDRLFLILLRKLTFKTFANRSLFFLGRGVGIPRTKKTPKQPTQKTWEEGVELRKKRGKYKFAKRQ